MNFIVIASILGPVALAAAIGALLTPPMRYGEPNPNRGGFLPIAIGAALMAGLSLITGLAIIIGFE